ncbi:hypothetical protein AB3N04_06275 [Alkalihalophilus sp. As8PL]|uniref:Small, acid-soluble spore protein gamma-type n=1 Tax=Alkalihalophilus sp. As8PL TaxID=3237103 RepID=A0AB39BW77_9BACI
MANQQNQNQNQQQNQQQNNQNQQQNQGVAQSIKNTAGSAFETMHNALEATENIAMSAVDGTKNAVTKMTGQNKNHQNNNRNNQ